MGKTLQQGYRQKCFLITKVGGRTKESVARQIDESLKRLQTDHVDLMQIETVKSGAVGEDESSRTITAPA